MLSWRSARRWHGQRDVLPCSNKVSTHPGFLNCRVVETEVGRNEMHVVGLGGSNALAQVMDHFVRWHGRSAVGATSL